MKKLSLLCASFVLVLSLAACQMSSVSMTSSEGIDVPGAMKTTLNTFFTQPSYDLTSQTYQSISPESEFQTMLEVLDWESLKSVQWTTYSREEGKATLRGQWIFGEDKVRQAGINLSEEEGWKVDGIDVQLDAEAIVKTFPEGDALKSRLAEDIQAFHQAFLDAKKEPEFLARFSRNAKTTISPEAIQKAISDFRKEKKDVALSGPEAITIAKDFPKQNGNMITVVGEYSNARFRVPFTITYDFEWLWKLSGFTLDPKRK